MMSRILAALLLLPASLTHAAASFSEVHEVVFGAAPPATSAEIAAEQAVYQQQQLPHYEVSSRQFIKDGVNLLRGDAQRTLNEHSDYYPRLEKHLHSNGICFAGDWKITATTPYTGYFRQGSQGLLVARASAALSETRADQPRALAFAGKIFPSLAADSKVDTANFFLVDNLAGTSRPHYLDTRMTNKPSAGFRLSVLPLAFQVFKIFFRADKDPGYRPVENIAALGEAAGTPIKAPRYLMLQGNAQNPHNNDSDFRDELNLRKHALAQLVFDIYVSDGSAAQDSKDWRVIGQITLKESTVSYGCDRRLHFAHPKIDQTTP